MMATVLLFQVDPRTQVLFQQEQDVAISVIRCDESNQVLTHLTAGTIRPEVVVLGSQLEQPAVVAEHIHAVDKDVTILISGAPDKATAIQNAIRRRSFWGVRRSACLAGKVPSLAPSCGRPSSAPNACVAITPWLRLPSNGWPLLGQPRCSPTSILIACWIARPLAVRADRSGRRHLAWNRYAELLFGVLEHEVMGTRFHQHLPESVVEPFTAFIRQSEATQRSGRFRIICNSAS